MYWLHEIWFSVFFLLLSTSVWCYVIIIWCVSLFMYTTITSDGYTVSKLSYYHLYCVMVYFINQAHYLHVLLVWYNMILNLWVGVVEMVYIEYFDIRKLWGPYILPRYLLAGSRNLLTGDYTNANLSIDLLTYSIFQVNTALMSDHWTKPTVAFQFHSFSIIIIPSCGLSESNIITLLVTINGPV